MTTPDLVLYHAPGACSQVSRCALEQAELPYRLELVNFASAESKAELARVSPLAKVPTLLIDGEVLTENAAIQVYIAALRPDAGLFPMSSDPRFGAEVQSGLSFCGGTLHPIVRGLFNPARLTTGEIDGVRERARELAEKSFGYAEARLAERGWWLGTWSILDVYLNWTVQIATWGGFDFAKMPQLASLQERQMERPSFARMMQGEKEARSALGQ